jgi:hypothetical protein
MSMVVEKGGGLVARHLRRASQADFLVRDALGAVPRHCGMGGAQASGGVEALGWISSAWLAPRLVLSCTQCQQLKQHSSLVPRHASRVTEISKTSLDMKFVILVSRQAFDRRPSSTLRRGT